VEQAGENPSDSFAMNSLPVGKLPAALLEKLLERHQPTDPRVLVGPRVGEDAALIEFGDRCLVAKTDPITFATDQLGWYAVQVNANDVACSGAVPRWFLATLLLPEAGTTPELVESLFEQIDSACRELGISLVGGHTEITWGLDRPIVTGVMLGEVARDSFVSTSGARPADRLIVTKGIAIEGTAILVREKADELAGVLDDDARVRAEAYLEWISVVADSRLALEAGGVHALHDPTEGGLATGLAELASAAEVGVEIDRDAIPVLPECRVICDHLGLDPLGLIASGCLLISADPDRSEAIIERLRVARIDAVDIGRVVEESEGCFLAGGNGPVEPLPRFDRDELARLFDRTGPDAGKRS